MKLNKLVQHLNSTAASRKKYAAVVSVHGAEQAFVQAQEAFVKFRFHFILFSRLLLRSYVGQVAPRFCDMLLRDTKRSAVTSLSRLVC